MSDRRVSIEVPGWTLEQRQGLDFLMEDAGIVGRWANDEVVVSPADASRVREFVEFLGATPAPTDVVDDASSDPVSRAPLPSNAGSAPPPERAAQPALRVRSVTLFTTSVLDADIGRYRRRPVTDHASGRRIGTAQRRWRMPFAADNGFCLRDTDDRVVIRVIPDWRMFAPRRWIVFGAGGEVVGSIVSAPRRWSEFGLEEWTGSVLLGNVEVALIQAGVVMDPATRRQLAAVSRTLGRGPKWRLEISDRVRGPMRAMVLAWLGVASDVHRTIDAASG